VTEEEELSLEVERLVFWHKVRGASFPDSRRIHGYAGFPDWIFCSNGRIKFWELKSESGTLKPDQIAWRYAIAAAGGDWAVMRPSDLESGLIGSIIETLSERT
jgi:hypothetical protein